VRTPTRRLQAAEEILNRVEGPARAQILFFGQNLDAGEKAIDDADQWV